MRASLLILVLLFSVISLVHAAEAVIPDSAITGTREVSEMTEVTPCADAGDCPACSALAGAPRAQMTLKLDTINYALNATFFYDNASASPMRRPLANSTVIVQMFNDTFSRTYRVYTDTNGKAGLDFTAYARGCMDFKVMYCPFTCPASSQCGFQNCLNYSNIACTPVACNAQSVPNAPGVSGPPSNLQCYMVFPTMDTVSYCPAPPPVSTVPTICLPLLLIFTLLGGGLFLSGRNPFAGFDFSAPRVGRHIRYDARGRGAGMTAPTFVSQLLQTAAQEGATKGAVAVAAATAQLTGGLGDRGKAAAKKVETHLKKADEKRGSGSTGMVAMVGGKPVVMGTGSGGGGGLWEMIKGGAVSPASRFGYLAQLGGLALKGSKSELAQQITGAFKTAGANWTAMGLAVQGATAKTPVIYSEAALGALQALLMAGKDKKEAENALAQFGPVVSQALGIDKNAQARKDKIEITGFKTEGGVFEITMKVNGKDVVVRLDEASLRLGTFNGQIIKEGKTYEVKDGLLGPTVQRSVAQIPAKEAEALAARYDMNDVKARIGEALKDAGNVAKFSGEEGLTIKLSNGDKITVRGDAESFSRGNFNIITKDNQVLAIGNAAPSQLAIVGQDKAALDKKYDVNAIQVAVQDPKAQAELKANDQTTIEVKGEKITITGDLASVNSGKYSVTTANKETFAVAPIEPAVSGKDATANAMIHDNLGNVQEQLNTAKAQKELEKNGVTSIVVNGEKVSVKGTTESVKEGNFTVVTKDKSVVFVENAQPAEIVVAGTDKAANAKVQENIGEIRDRLATLTQAEKEKFNEKGAITIEVKGEWMVVQGNTESVKSNSFTVLTEDNQKVAVASVGGRSEIVGQDHAAFEKKGIEVSEVQRQVLEPKAQAELREHGTTTVNLEKGGTVTITRDETGGLRATTEDNKSIILAEVVRAEIAAGPNAAAFEKKGIDVNDVQLRLGTREAQTDIALKGQTTIEINGQKITIEGNGSTIEEKAASIMQCSYGMTTADGKSVSVAPVTTPELVGATVELNSKDLKTFTKALGLEDITARLKETVVIDNKFEAKEFGGTVVVKTSPLGEKEDYTVVRPASKDDPKTVEFRIQGGDVKEIIDRSNPDKPVSLKVDAATGIKVNDSAPIDMPQHVKLFSAAMIQDKAANQEVAHQGRVFYEEVQHSRLATDMEKAGMPEEVLRVLKPEVHAAIAHEANQAAAIEIAKRDYPQNAREFVEAWGRYDAAKKQMEPERAYEASGLREMTQKPFAEYNGIERSEIAKELEVRYGSKLLDRAEVKGALSKDADVDELKRDLAKYGEKIAEAAAAKRPAFQGETQLGEAIASAERAAASAAVIKPQEELQKLDRAIEALENPPQAEKELGEGLKRYRKATEVPEGERLITPKIETPKERAGREEEIRDIKLPTREAPGEKVVIETPEEIAQRQERMKKQAETAEAEEARVEEARKGLPTRKKRPKDES